MPMELKTPGFYEFGPFRLEPTEHRLIRDGTPIPVSPKAFEVLLLLVENQAVSPAKSKSCAPCGPRASSKMQI